ncbi:MAG: oligosaccharide flippase family protein [Actinomycetota bacterium]|nr:oligosaccharide flippase family protein [Actinomycetota bacterium]
MRESTPALPADLPPQQHVGSGQARLIASGSLVQQLSQVTGLLAIFAIITVLARRLTLAELGVYGLLTSLAGYLLVIQNSSASAAVRNMAAAKDAAGRDRSFSTATLIYAAAGAVAGVLLAGVGLVLSAAVDLPGGLERQARLGSISLGLIAAVGWPITVYRDAMRASQLLVRVAVIEIASIAVYAGVVLGLAFAGADLAVLIAASGTLPLLAGLGAAIGARLTRLPYRFRRGAATREDARAFARLAGYVSASEAAGTVIYALDRVILGLFKGAATVGLYEGPVRAHNLVRALNAAVSVTVLPPAASYFSASDERRLGELLTRGVRYTLGLVVPLTVTGMVLAPPILEVWLGPEFRAAGPAMAILMSYWLVNGCTGVLQAIVIAGERARALARLAGAVALSNVAISLALTPWLGLEGVTIGTAVPYLVAFPFLMGVVLDLVPVAARALARESFLPAYSLGAALAVVLGLARLELPLDTAPAVLGIAAAGVLAYWAAFYLVWLRPEERRLVREVGAGLVPGSSRVG